MIPMSQEFLRYEINQKAKAVLLRHSVDLTLLDVSFSGTALYLYGRLAQHSTGDFSPSELESLVKELSALPGVTYLEFDLDNWNIYPDLNTWRVLPKKKMSHGGSGSGETVEIKREEDIREVLEDMSKDRKNKKEDSENRKVRD